MDPCLRCVYTKIQVFFRQSDCINRESSDQTVFFQPSFVLLTGSSSSFYLQGRVLFCVLSWSSAAAARHVWVVTSLEVRSRSGLAFLSPLSVILKLFGLLFRLAHWSSSVNQHGLTFRSINKSQALAQVLLCLLAACTLSRTTPTHLSGSVGGDDRPVHLRTGGSVGLQGESINEDDKLCLNSGSD